jgi:hypothetical protein
MEKRLPYGKKIEKPIFITGIGRSGSTILGVFLSLHPDVGYLNEPKALWHSVVPFEDIIGSYSDGPARFRLTKDDASIKAKKWARALYASYLTFSGSKRVVDKYPELIYRIPFLLEIFPDAKIIFLTRNGEHVCGSVRSWSVRKGDFVAGQTHDWWGRNRRKWRILVKELVENNPWFADSVEKIRAYQNHMDMAMVEWIVSMQEGLAMAKEYDRNVYTIRYEDIRKAPRKELGMLLDFCELGKDEKMLSYAVEALQPPTSYHHMETPPELALPFAETMAQLGYIRGK